MATQQSIFVVDDDESIRRSVQRLLRISKLQCKCFGDPNEFLRSLKPQTVGCVILDVHMPQMNALAVQRQLAQEHPGLAVVIITGFPDVNLQREVMDAGAIAYLQKPFSGEALLAAVQDALHSTT